MVMIYFFRNTVRKFLLLIRGIWVKLYGVHIAAGKIGRCIDIQTAITVALLVLKRRVNKNLLQLIIASLASLDKRANFEIIRVPSAI